jgi:ArsR family transcriptional regulator
MNSYQDQAQFFKVLSHPTRLAILDILRDGEQCVCHMEAVLKLRQAHISQHLMLLRDAGLVTDRRDGWNIFYRVMQPEIFEVVDETYRLLGIPKDEQPRPLRVADCPCPKCNPGSNCGISSISHRSEPEGN